MPVDFAASGAAALTVTGHKLGGPVGRRRAAARPRRRRARRCCTAAARSATCAPARSTPPGIVAFAVAVEAAVKSQQEYAARVGRAARRPGGAGAARRCPDAVYNGDPADRLPGNAHFSFPGCEGDALLLLLDAQGIACSTGSACSAGVAQPSHVLLAMGADDDRARSSLRFTLGHTSTAADVDALRRRAARRRSSGPAGPDARPDDPALTAIAGVRIRLVGMRVLAAMSGGVDSAVAAARAVDAGHDVTGVHLALARNPQTYRTGARGCCTLEDSRDARRAADVIGIPFYVWDMAERVPRRTWSTTSSPSTPPAARPTRACAATRRSSSPRCWTGRWRWASTRWSPATTPGSAPDGLLRRSVDAGQGPVVRAGRADPRRSSTGRCSRSATRPRRRCAPRRPRAAWRWPTSPTRTTSASSPTATPAGFLADAARRGARRHRRRAHRRGGRHARRARTRYTVGQRKGLDLRPCPRRTAGRATCCRSPR